MKRFSSLITIFSVLALVLSGCNSQSPDVSTESSSTGTYTESGSQATSEDSTSNDADENISTSSSDQFTDRDFRTEYDEADSIKIELNGSSATASSNTVQIADSVITITEETTYIISGTLDDGMIIVDTTEDAKLQLVFDNVNINSSTTAPIYILEADKVFITLADGSENTVSNTGSFSSTDETNIDGTIFSKQDLTFNGTGSLTVSSSTGHGIVCKDDLVFTGGTYYISSASHGLDANDSIRITNSTFELVTGKDGMHAENTDDSSLGYLYIEDGSFNITAEGDGISSGAYGKIINGTFDIVAGGGSENGSNEHSDSWGEFGGGGMNGGGMNGGGMNGGGMNGGKPGSMPGDMSNNMSGDTSSTSSEDTTDESSSMKGIKTSGSLIIEDGSFDINSADDGLHSNISMDIYGGTFEIATGDDGIHAEETLVIEDGSINITESYEGLEALDINIKGGDISLISSDDGMNAAGGVDQSGVQGGRDGEFGNPMHGGMSANSNGSIVISGGTIHIYASGDGIDANGSLEMSDGYVEIVGPTVGDTATLDYDTTATITGGTFIGVGASNMAQSFSDTEQGVIAVSAGTQTAGTVITLTDDAGNEILSYTTYESFQVIILSSPDIKIGESYTLSVGDLSESFEAY